MNPISALTALALITLTGCSGYYADEVKAPSDQELHAARTTIEPTGALREGVFHMSKVQTGSSVLLEDPIVLNKPDLPPFDVAYISRDLESVLLELSNAAGESIVIPQGLRGRTITLVHSGGDFKTMLNLVLGKAGYHYNYVDGVWHITRYPIRNYVLEVGQSNRSGSMVSSAELPAAADESGTSASGVPELDTSYSDQIWQEVRGTLEELIKVGENGLKNDGLSAQGVTGTGQIITEGQSANANLELLPPPELEGTPETEEALFGVLTVDGVRPYQISNPASTDHLVPEEQANPWMKVTESAGLITVRAAPEAHRQIETYLEQIQETSHRQVVIEARIIALIKDKSTDRGAGFQKSGENPVDDVLSSFGFNASSPVSFTDPIGGFLTLNTAKNDLNFVVQSLSTIGDVYTISSPKILARNNQISRVSVTRQLGFAETEVDQNTTSAGDIVIGSRQDKARFKNAGTVMSVLPYIGKGNVQMRFRLSVATKSGDTQIRTAIGDEDPIVNLVPELSNNVIDQDMILEFGRIYAIGGLIETSTTLDESYEPFLQQIPGFREIARRANNRQQDTEFIVLIKISRS